MSKNRSNISIAPILFVIIQSKILVYGISLSNKSVRLPDFQLVTTKKTAIAHKKNNHLIKLFVLIGNIFITLQRRYIFRIITIWQS